VSSAVAEHHILRLRLRRLNGEVVWSDDGSGFTEGPDDEALTAAGGTDVIRLDHLNADGNEALAPGVAAVEVYLPLIAGASPRRVDVLEVYLPYAPIRSDVTAGLHRLYVDLGIALALLYVALFLISASIGRGLRREVRRNAFLAEHDPLTGLPNRAMFHRRAAVAVERSGRNGPKTIVALIDLDRFREINDTLGHRNGDLLLCELARRLALHMRPRDTVARLGSRSVTKGIENDRTRAIVVTSGKGDGPRSLRSRERGADLEPCGLSFVGALDTPAVRSHLDHRQAPTAGGIRVGLGRGRKDIAPVVDTHPDAWSGQVNPHVELGAGMHDGIGRQLADEKHRHIEVCGRAGGDEAITNEPSGRVGAGRYRLEGCPAHEQPPTVLPHCVVGQRP
jgi:hypothetical protein